MKDKKNHYLAFALGVLAANSVQANSYMGANSGEYYYGANAQYIISAPKTEYKDFFRKYHPGPDLYVGYRVNRMFSVEMGYGWTSRTSKETSFSLNQTTFNGNFAVNPATDITGKIRYKNTHFDLNGYYPIGQHIDGIVSVGIGFLRPSVHVALSNANSNLYNEVANMKCKTNAVARLGLGFEGMLGDYWGLRSIVRYENTGRTQVRNAGFGGTKILRDSMSVGLGFYRYLD